MRQPYTYDGQGPRPVISANVLETRPEFVPKIAAVSAEWNTLDANMSMLFAMLLAGQEPTAFAIYYDVLRGQSRNRKRIFDAVAKALGLPTDTLQDVSKLRKEVDSWGDRRNEIVHALWAVQDGRPNLLAVKANFEWLANFHDLMSHILDAAHDPTNALPEGEVQVISEYWEFTLADLDEAILAIQELSARAVELHGKIASHSVPNAQKRQKLKVGNILDRLEMETQAAQDDGETKPPDQGD